jgi:hypothetical protein
MRKSRLKGTDLYKKIGKSASGSTPADSRSSGWKTTPGNGAGDGTDWAASWRSGRSGYSADGYGRYCYLQREIDDVLKPVCPETIPGHLEAGWGARPGPANVENADQGWTVDNEEEVLIERLARRIVTGRSRGDDVGAKTRLRVQIVRLAEGLLVRLNYRIEAEG